MALSPSLSRKLRDTLGQDAGGDLVTWLDEEREARAHVDAQMAAFRQEIIAMETRLRTEIASVKSDLTNQIVGVKSDLTNQIAEVKTDLMKWSFVFWCGSVAAIAALA